MAFLGRETEAEKQRIERMRSWIHARTPYALISPALGMLAIVDFWTLVLGLAAGVAAVITGNAGLRDLKVRPQLQGRRMCVTGIGLGIVGLLLTLVMWLWGFAWLAGGG